MENKAICWRNCHCDCEVSPTLSTNTPVCPLPSYSPAVTSCSPDIVTVFVHKDAMVNHGIAHKQICIASPSLYHVWSIYISRLGEASILSNALAKVQSWILGSRFIWANVYSKFSFKMSLRQSLISAWTLTWFLPPRGLSAILPSRMYLATIDLYTDTAAILN